MAGETSREELDEILTETREAAEDHREGLARYGIEVMDVGLDLSPRPFPDLLVSLVHEHVPGVRVLRSSLEQGGRLVGSTDMAQGVIGVILEYPWPLFAALPHAGAGQSGRAEPGELAAIVDAVRDELRRRQGELRDRDGLEVTGVEIDPVAGALPDLLIVLKDNRTPGERVLRQSLDWGGLPSPEEAAEGLVHLVLEWPVIAHLPLAAPREAGSELPD